MEVQLLDKIRWANLVSSLPWDNLFRNSSFREYLAKASSMIPLSNNSTNRRQPKVADLGSQTTSRIMPMEVSKFQFRIHRSKEVSFNQKTAAKATTRVKSRSEGMMESSNNSRTQWWKQVKELIPASEMSKAHRQFRELMIRMKSPLMRTTCMKSHQTWECIPNSSKIYLEFRQLIPWATGSKLWGSILNSSSVIRLSSLHISTWTTSKKMTMMIKQMMSLKEFLVAERWNSYRWSYIYSFAKTAIIKTDMPINFLFSKLL